MGEGPDCIPVVGPLPSVLPWAILPAAAKNRRRTGHKSGPAGMFRDIGRRTSIGISLSAQVCRGRLRTHGRRFYPNTGRSGQVALAGGPNPSSSRRSADAAAGATRMVWAIHPQRGAGSFSGFLSRPEGYDSLRRLCLSSRAWPDLRLRQGRISGVPRGCRMSPFGNPAHSSRRRVLSDGAGPRPRPLFARPPLGVGAGQSRRQFPLPGP